MPGFRVPSAPAAPPATFVADLHIHSRYSRACSRDLDLPTLALWARRLIGEALVQAQRVAVDRDALARLLVGGTMDLAAVGQMLARLTQRHTERMSSLGLTA